MSNIRKSLFWAAAILLNAAGNYLGLIDDETAEIMFVVLPGVAVATMGVRCEGWRRRQET